MLILCITNRTTLDLYLLGIIMLIKTFDKHFYDEDNIEIGKPMHNAQIAVNHIVVLTAEEKEQARQDAMQKAQDEAYRTMTQLTKKAKKVALTIQPSLFDF